MGLLCGGIASIWLFGLLADCGFRVCCWNMGFWCCGECTYRVFSTTQITMTTRNVPLAAKAVAKRSFFLLTVMLIEVEDLRKPRRSVDVEQLRFPTHVTFQGLE